MNYISLKMNYIEFKVAKNSNIPQFNEIIKQWYIDNY